MTFGLTANGFTLKTLADIQQSISDYQRLYCDPSLVLDSISLLKNINDAHALELSKLWELGQAIFASFDPDTATGWSLDQLAALTGTYREGYSKTTVTGQVTLNPNKALPVGSIANLTGMPSIRFLTTVEVPADPSGGTFDVVFEAEEYGPTPVAIGQLSEINVAVSGWTAVTNAAEGTPGSEPEEDDEFHDVRETELAASGSTNLSAILAGVSRVDGVLFVDGAENPYSLFYNGLPKNTVHIIHYGGVAADVAAAILEEKAAGISTYGSTTTTVQDADGNSYDIKHTVATELTFYATIVVTTNDLWNGATSIANIKSFIAAYINGLGIGNDVIYDKVKSLIFDEPGVQTVTSCFIDFAPAPSGTSDLSVANTEIALADVANISVS